MEAKSNCFIFNGEKKDISPSSGSPFAQSSVSGLSHHQTLHVFMLAVNNAAKQQPGSLAAALQGL